MKTRSTNGSPSTRVALAHESDTKNSGLTAKAAEVAKPPAPLPSWSCTLGPPTTTRSSLPSSFSSKSRTWNVKSENGDGLAIGGPNPPAPSPSMIARKGAGVGPLETAVSMRSRSPSPSTSPTSPLTTPAAGNAVGAPNPPAPSPSSTDTELEAFETLTRSGIESPFTSTTASAPPAPIELGGPKPPAPSPSLTAPGKLLAPDASTSSLPSRFRSSTNRAPGGFGSAKLGGGGKPPAPSLSRETRNPAVDAIATSNAPSPSRSTAAITAAAPGDRIDGPNAIPPAPSPRRTCACARLPKPKTVEVITSSLPSPSKSPTTDVVAKERLTPPAGAKPPAPSPRKTFIPGGPAGPAETTSSFASPFMSASDSEYG